MTDRHYPGEFPDLEAWLQHLIQEHWPVETWAIEDHRDALRIVHDRADLDELFAVEEPKP